jgi:hypothetical protein
MFKTHTPNSRFTRWIRSGKKNSESVCKKVRFFFISRYSLFKFEQIMLEQIKRVKPELGVCIYMFHRVFLN